MSLSSHLSLIFKNPKYSIGYIIGVIILAILWWKFTDFDLIKGNNGELYYYLDIVISVINITLFPLFIVAWIYRSYTFGSASKNAWSHLGFFGGIIGIIISGSLCCGSSLLFTFGASAMIHFLWEILPYGGMELKIFGVIILIYALVSLLKNLLTCKIQKSNKKTTQS